MNQKQMSLKEFRDKGYLQEVNRKFLHPLGLAISLSVNEEDPDDIQFSHIWDCREDPEGILFGTDVSEELIQDRKDKATYVELEKKRKVNKRSVLEECDFTGIQKL